jgi:hypothetical protein
MTEHAYPPDVRDDSNPTPSKYLEICPRCDGSGGWPDACHLCCETGTVLTYDMPEGI